VSASSVDFTTLTLAEVSRVFGRRRALNRVSFRADAGELVAVLGPNGAGKSTLLSIVATLMLPSSGRVLYGVQESDRSDSSLRARIGLLGHDLYIYPELSPAENLRFFGRLYGLEQIERRVGEGLERAGLVERRDDAVSGFSRGMRQRLAVERALLHDPRLVLLDEPFTGLDDRAIEGLKERLGSLREAGCITLIATHDLEHVEGIIDRGIVLREGRLVEISKGTAPLRERYRAAIAE
jgi:ABC-type multidrug transport system ATPase subunit